MIVKIAKAMIAIKIQKVEDSAMMKVDGSGED